MDVGRGNDDDVSSVGGGSRLRDLERYEDCGQEMHSPHKIS